jgi:benzoyl-CoA-dihydrodiol lyase
VPLLGVLPGTGGLTRVTDKRRARRDHADVFCTLTEGVRASRALEWRLIDGHAKPQAFAETVRKRALELAAASDRPQDARGVALTPLARTIDDAGYHYDHVDVRFDRALRAATITVRAPASAPASTPAAIEAAGASWWPLAMARELDDAILLLRTNELALGTWILKTEGDAAHVLAADAALAEHRAHWFVRETIGMLRRTLARLDVSSRSLFALVEPGSCVAGPLLALARIPCADGRDLLARARRLPDGQRPHTARAALRRRADGDRALPRRGRARADRRRGARARPRHVRARRPRLGRRGAHRARGARKPLARRALRPGGEPALPGRGDDGVAHLRPPFGVAELDLRPAQRRRRVRRAQGVRYRTQGVLQPGSRVTHPTETP